METRRITVLSAGLGVPSSSRLLADQLAASAERQLSAAGYAVTVDVVELRDLAVDIANNFVTGYAAPRLAEVIAGVEASDGIIAVTPGVQRLLQRPVQVLHRRARPEVPGWQGRPARRNRRHRPPPDGPGLRDAPAVQLPAHQDCATGVFAGPQDWGNADDGGSPLAARIDRAADEFTGLLEGFPPGRKPAPMESLPFEQSLAGISGERLTARFPAGLAQANVIRGCI